MKTFTVAQAKPQLGKLVERAHRGKPVVLVHKNKLAQIVPFEPLDLEDDNPELEALLLEGVRSKFSPYSHAKMTRILDRICREERKK